MKTYLNNLIEEKGLDLEEIIEEKGLDLEEIIEVEGASGTNFIPLGVVVEHILITSNQEKKQIRNTLVKIDFKNGDVMHFFKYLAQAISA